MNVWRMATAVVALTASVNLAADQRQADPRPTEVVLVGAYRGIASQFSIRALPVQGLHPGATKRMTVKTENRYAFRIRIAELAGRLTGTSRRGCHAMSANLLVGRYSGLFPIDLQPHSRRELPGFLPISMPKDATPKCSNTRFHIELRGIGRKASR